MDAAIPVDAKTAPTGIWKTAQNAVSHSAHTRHRCCMKTKDTLRDRRQSTCPPIRIRSSWADTPQVEKTFELLTKAPVVGGTTRDSTWTGPLHNTGIGAEALTIVRGMSMLGAAEPRMRRLPFNVASPRQTGTGSGGGWVAEGASIGAVAYAWDAVTPKNYKLQSMTVISDRLALDPFADRTNRESVFGTHAPLTDTQFLDPAVAAVTDSNPASITNGATAITSTGTTAAQNHGGPRRNARGHHNRRHRSRVDHAADDAGADRLSPSGEC